MQNGCKWQATQKQSSSPQEHKNFGQSRKAQSVLDKELVSCRFLSHYTSLAMKNTGSCAEFRLGSEGPSQYLHFLGTQLIHGNQSWCFKGCFICISQLEHLLFLSILPFSPSSSANLPLNGSHSTVGLAVLATVAPATPEGLDSSNCPWLPSQPWCGFRGPEHPIAEGSEGSGELRHTASLPILCKLGLGRTNLGQAFCWKSSC